MRVAALVLLFALFAPAAFAVKLKLKAEEKEAETELVALSGDEVSYRRGRRDFTAKIDDFTPASAFAIKKQFTADQPRLLFELARFALHRALFAETREAAKAATKLDAALGNDAESMIAVADILEADGIVEAAAALVEQAKPAEARPLLTTVRERFPKTPAAIEAEVLLSTLESVELELKARQLEEDARKAQDAVDADERKKRQPVEDWLTNLAEQTKAAENKKIEADADTAANKMALGLPKYEATVNTAAKLRKSIEENRRLLTYRGQAEMADTLDARAKRLMIDCYERWAYCLYKIERYQVASEVCGKGIQLDPKDRRLLALKVDIDEMWDPTEK